MIVHSRTQRIGHSAGPHTTHARARPTPVRALQTTRHRAGDPGHLDDESTTGAQNVDTSAMRRPGHHRSTVPRTFSKIDFDSGDDPARTFDKISGTSTEEEAEEEETKNGGGSKKGNGANNKHSPVPPRNPSSKEGSTSSPPTTPKLSSKLTPASAPHVYQQSVPRLVVWWFKACEPRDAGESAARNAPTSSVTRYSMPHACARKGHYHRHIYIPRRTTANTEAITPAVTTTMSPGHAGATQRRRPASS